MNRKNKLALFLTIGICVVLTIAFSVVYISLLSGKTPSEKTPPVVSQNIGQERENKEQTNTEIPPVPEKNENRVTFSAVGDNIIHGMVMDDARKRAGSTQQQFDFLSMYENIMPLIEKADIAFVNQEGAIAGNEMGYSGYPNFNTPEKAVYDLVSCGFDVFNVANNHMLDKGVRGYQNTVSFFNSLEGITTIGGYNNSDDYENIRIVEKNGIRIALLSYTYGTNGYYLDSRNQMVVPYANDTEIDRQTKNAREMADFVVVSIHWGTENSDVVNETQKRQTEIMAQNGVDVIIGTHPHVLQPVEWFDRPDGNKMLVAYSLGNFLSNMERMYHHVGAVLTFDFVNDENGTRIENVSVVPTLCHFETDGGVNRDYKIMRLSEYTDSLLSVHARQNTGTDVKRDMSYLYNIIRENIPNEFLTEDFYRNY